MSTKPKDISGLRFGRWTAIERAPSDPKHNSRWLCRCDCGAERVVMLQSLRAGLSLSCGCHQRERVRATSTRHGHTAAGRNSPEYTSWQSMRSRCCDPKNDRFKDYGGRGIRVCDRWQKFEAFLADMGPRPRGTSLERLENDGHYEPVNCVWATRIEQARNTRRCRVLAFRGESLPVAAWAERLGIHQATIGARLKRGWSVDGALSTPARERTVW